MVFQRCSAFFYRNARFFQTPFYFALIFLGNTLHKFLDQSSSPHYQCCFQVSETVSWQKLRCRYSANILQHWVGGRGLIYFCKVGHSRIFINFSRNWLGLNSLCEILQSLLSYLSHLTTLPMTNMSLQNRNIFPLGRQGKQLTCFPCALGLSRSNQHYHK